MTSAPGMQGDRPAVRELRWRPFRLRMRHRFQAAHGALEDREGVLSSLRDADGRVGVGEASPMPSLGHGSITDVLALLEAHRADLLDPACAAGLAGLGADALRCALDVASLDLRAQAGGRSVASLLAVAPPAPWVMSNAVIGGGSPQEVAQYGRAAVEHGYAVLKVKVGVASVSEDHRRLSSLREACPEAVLRLDANGAWDEATAREASEAFAPLGIELLEQPVAAPQVGALARLRAHGPMRIAADEAVGDPETLARVLDERAADLLVLKPMVLGGLTAAAEVAARAAQRGISAFVTTTFDSSIGTAAALHLAAALPADVAHGLATGEHLATDLTATTLAPERGRLALPVAHGLGVTVDEAALEAAATAPWRSAEG